MDPPRYFVRPTEDGRLEVRFRMRCGCVTPSVTMGASNLVEPLADDVSRQVCQHHLVAFAIEVSNDLMLRLQDQFVGPPAPRKETP